MLNNVTDTVAEAGLEVVHDQMREGLANGVNLILQIVAKDNIVETEIGGWAIRHVADDKTIRLTSGLVDHDQVREAVGLSNLNQILKHVATTIDSR